MQMLNREKYRTLTTEEIATLVDNGSKAEDWSKILVAKEGFSPERICRCRFKGEVIIGAEVTIKDVSSFIANYIIGDKVKIVNVGLLETKGDSSFGNGTEVATINENGGRSIRIYDNLSVQAAYINALYRHRPDTIAKLEEIALNHTKEVTSHLGSIGCGARLCDCKIVRNVRIGDHAEVIGASLLQNGTILSTKLSRTEIGVDVKLYDFIVQEGASIDNGSLMRKCFVGQSVIVENLTATDSLFFANSHMENCEACSIFAGPYTVSHHASSLLIAGMFSFFNAGSGTNQSNHLFRTGAVHQGIHLRGVKFGSNAYTMLPCCNGAFTVVVGRHRNHGDTDSFPFSYLVEKEGESHLLPGRNLMSYGTVRDLKKWPQRDRRQEFKRDNINFQECNPYIGVRFEKAIETLDQLLAVDRRTSGDILNWGRMKIARKAASQGRRIYQAALYKYLGEMLATPTSALPKGLTGRGHWIDCGGQYMPLTEMHKILQRVDNGEIDSAEQLKEAFDIIMDNYDALSRDWALGVAEKMLGHTPDEQDIATLIQRGREASEKFNNSTERDRNKDFDEISQVGYGIDCLTPEERMADFRAVRGE